MRRPLIAVLVVMSIIAAGCASSTPPAWTYAPPTPQPTPGPSGSPGASGAPSASGPAASAVASAVASAEAGGSPAAGGSPGASGAAGAPVVIEALNLEFKTPEVNGPASVPFTIEFRNEDAGTPHNVDIKDSSGNEAFKGDIVTGVIVATYNVPALAPGTYPFVCDVHPNMTGTLKIGG